MKYEDFIASKHTEDEACGMKDIPALNPAMFPQQRDIVAWALRRGRACVFADCGMGKTLIELEWSRCVPADVLVLAPLAVAEQTIREAAKFGGYDIAYSADGTKRGKITISNYERLEKFNPADFGAIVLDESSILKNYNGHFRNLIMENWRLPFRLACSATPAPNDFMELGNHAEFVGIMNRIEMLSMFFTHDGSETQKWRLKGHAARRFWRWMTRWAVMIRKPSDLGYSDDGFTLPPLNMEQVTVETQSASAGFLFPMEAQSLQERQAARRDSVAERVAAAANLIEREPGAQWLIWCDLNTESAALAKAIPGAVEVKGSDSDEHKTRAMLGFQTGEVRVLVSKPSIAGMGLNFQGCHNQIFVGLSDSYERFYQAVRRCWRYGQTQAVNCYIVTAATEGAVVANIRRKEAQAEEMAAQMVANMSELNSAEVRGIAREVTDYTPKKQFSLPSFMTA